MDQNGVRTQIRTAPAWRLFAVNFLSAVDAIDVSMEALRRLNLHAMAIDQALPPTTIAATTCPSWQCFGERIEVEITPSGANRSRIRFTTRPVLRTTIADYGKGAENVLKFASAIEARMEDGRPL